MRKKIRFNSNIVANNSKWHHKPLQIVFEKLAFQVKGTKISGDEEIIAMNNCDDVGKDVIICPLNFELAKSDSIL